MKIRLVGKGLDVVLPKNAESGWPSVRQGGTEKLRCGRGTKGKNARVWRGRRARSGQTGTVKGGKKRSMGTVRRWGRGTDNGEFGGENPGKRQFFMKVRTKGRQLTFEQTTTRNPKGLFANGPNYPGK